MLSEKYFVRTEPIDNTSRYGKNVWNSLEVTVFQKGEDGSEERIGSYERNYHSLYKTFHPFRKNGKEYALYSPHYTATRVMELPSCRDIAGEEPGTYGFCPVEYYVPEEENEDARYAFVSGCVWGDDTSWKLQSLDLSKIEEQRVEREEKFGYLELPAGLALKDTLSIERYEDDTWLEIATFKRFRADHDLKQVETYNEEKGAWEEIYSDDAVRGEVEIADMGWVQLPLMRENDSPVADVT